MKRRIRQVIFLLGILISCCLLGGCESEDNHNVSITLIHAWGGTEKDHAEMRDIYAEFPKEYPEIDLQIISMPTSEEMMRKVEDMVMVGNVPDIISFSGVGENCLYDFLVENDMALDIQPYIERDNDFSQSISDVNKEYWKTKNGELYSVSDVLMLSGGYWYNEDILNAAGIEQVPKSWDEFQMMCNQISDWALKEGTEITALQPAAEGYLYCIDHMLSGSEQARTKGQQFVYQEEEFTTAINQLKQLYSLSVSKTPEYSYRDETNLFNEGKLAIYINGVWSAPMISDDINAKYALLPSCTEKTVSCESSGLGYVLGKSGNEERQEAAVSFLKYMLSKDVQLQILERTEQIPANPDVSVELYKENKDKLYQAVSLVLEADEKIEVPSNIWSLEQKNYFTESIFDLLAGTISVQEFEENIKMK